MSIKQQLFELRDLSRLLATRSQEFNEQPRLVNTAEALADLQVSQQALIPNTQDLQGLQRKFKNALNKKKWDTITPRDWRRAPWVLWYGREPLAQNPAFLHKLWSVIEENPRLLRRVIRVYLRDFNAETEQMEAVAAFLRQQLASLPPEHTLARWQRSQQVYQLFTPSTDTVQNLVDLCLQYDPVTVLSDAGLTGELALTGLAPTVYLNALQQLGERLQQAIAAGQLRQAAWQALKWHYTDHRVTLQTWFGEVEADAPEPVDYGEYLLKLMLTWSSEQGRLRYPQQRRELGHALLLPWLQDNPPQAIRENIHVFLLQHLGDPRVSAGAWQGIQKNALKVFYRWMVGATLETFFNLLDQCALDSQWRYRRAFWWAYYERQYIDEAWLALGKSTQSFLAKKPALARSVQDAYGTLGGRGIKGRQSVLLFRIKNLIIAEWSHGGRCHVWHVDNPYAPSLYQTQYLREHVTRESEKLKPEHKVAGISHYGNETGSWQADMASFIAENTGIRVNEVDYRPVD